MAFCHTKGLPQGKKQNIEKHILEITLALWWPSVLKKTCFNLCAYKCEHSTQKRLISISYQQSEYNLVFFLIHVSCEEKNCLIVPKRNASHCPDFQLSTGL